MSTEIQDVPWQAVTDDGFAMAEIQITPLDRLEIAELNLSFYYTGDGPGLIKLYRDMKSTKGGTWILRTAMDGELSTDDDKHWHVNQIKPRNPT
jgi:hypothetical protein